MIAGLPALLLASSCQAFKEQQGEPYYLADPPWIEKSAASAGPEKLGHAATKAGQESVLEKLQETSLQLKDAMEKNAELGREKAALDQSLAALRLDNESLRQLADSIQKERDGAQDQVLSMQDRVRDSEQRYRDLVDELLAERIQRVRVERELILSKINEARESEDS